MNALLQLIFSICLLQKGPQDIPASPWILRIILPCYLVVNLIVLNYNVDFSTSLLQLLFDLISLSLFTLLLLNLFKKPARFSQTFSALLATDALLTTLIMPVLSSFSENPTLLPFIVILLTILWHWLITGHIFRHALEQSFTFSLGVVLLYFILVYWLNSNLFPELSQANTA